EKNSDSQVRSENDFSHGRTSFSSTDGLPMRLNALSAAEVTASGRSSSTSLAKNRSIPSSGRFTALVPGVAAGAGSEARNRPSPTRPAKNRSTPSPGSPTTVVRGVAADAREPTSDRLGRVGANDPATDSPPFPVPPPPEGDLTGGMGGPE